MNDQDKAIPDHNTPSTKAKHNNHYIHPNLNVFLNMNYNSIT